MARTKRSVKPDTSEMVQKILEGQLRLENKVDLHIQKTEFELKQIQKLDAEQNLLLAQHAQRSEEIKRDNELREKRMREEVFGERPNSLKSRIDKLEVPQKWLEHTKSALLYLAAIGGAITAILKFLQYIA